LGHSFSTLCWFRVRFHVFSSVTGLPSTTSACPVSTALVRRLRWYYARVRLLPLVHARICLLASRAVPGLVDRPDAGEVSRFSRVQFLDVLLALGLRRAKRILALAHPPLLPSRCKHTVGARIAFFEAQFPARRCLCLRFTDRSLAVHLCKTRGQSGSLLLPLWGSFIPDCTPVYPGDCAY